MRTRPALPLLALGLLAGCVPAERMPSTLYVRPVSPAPLAIAFAPRAAELPAASARAVRQYAAAIPGAVVPTLFAAGPLASRRADAVARLIGRPVRIALSATVAPDEALLVVPDAGPVVSAACNGPGAPVPEDIWPGNDDRRPRLLPPGCAVATTLAAQVTRPDDLLRGRPLPPGAALPYAQAIERYDHRNDMARTMGEPVGGGSGDTSNGQGQGQGQQGQSQTQGQNSQGAGGNPLLGGLSPSNQGQAPASPTQP